MTAIFVYDIVDLNISPIRPMGHICPMIRLSVSEAAKFFGIEQKTIRRALKAGELRYVVIRGRYRIAFESLLEWSQRRPKVRNKLQAAGLGQYVNQWKIHNRLYSPNPAALKKTSELEH